MRCASGESVDVCMRLLASGDSTMGVAGAARPGTPASLMDVADLELARAWVMAGWALALPMLAVAAWRADWSRAFENEPVHGFLGALAAMVVLWSIRGHVGGVFAFHLLGSAALALAAGAWRALAGGAVAVGLVTLLRGAPPENAAWIWLTLVALPVAVSAAVLAATERWLPPNLFIYVFAASFGGAALSMLAGGLAGFAVGVLAAGLAADVVFGEYAPFLIYLAFGEATLTGMLITLAVVYRPQWVATFDDRRYLSRDR